MSKSRKVQLEKKIMIFLSSGVFIFSGLYASNVQAAPVFSSGSASDSTVAGVNNTASANSSSAFGYFNTAGGLASSAFGWSNTASAENASAFGYVNEASGLASSALGFRNKAANENASAVGYGNNAGGVASSAFGFSNVAKVDYASAFGYSNEASGLASSAVGFRNKAASENASAVGYGNNANALAASAVGYNNTAGGVGSSTIGYNNTATNENASAFGYGNTAGGLASSAFGFSNTASGDNANAFGYNNIASGSKSNVFGTGNTVSGSSSTAVGTANEVAAENSTAIGNNNTISSGAENSAALGNNISISLKDSVALGNNSTATAINSVTGNSSYTKWAGVSDVVGVVSNVVVTSTTNSSGGTDYEVKLADELEIGTGVKVDGTGDGKIEVGNGNVVIDGSDGSITAGGVTINKDDEGTINGLTNTTWDPDNITSGQAATEDQLKAIYDTAAEAVELAAQQSSVSTGDSNFIVTKTTNDSGGIDHELKLNEVVEIGSGANKVTIDGNNGTINTGNINMNGTNGVITADKITIDGGAGTIGGLTNTAWDAENITSGQAATEDQLKTVSDSAIKYDVDSGGTINKNKITLEGSNGTTIGNVAAGEVSATSMDAINGSQLYAVQQDIGNIHRDINKLGDEIDTVGALSAAMAGLHPRFQDGNKGELAMAYGGYGGKSALAVGGFYAPNEKVMFSLGLGVSEGGSKMGNFGVNFALDRSRDRKAEARDIVYTRKEVDSSLAAQDEKIKLLLAKLEEQSREIEELKAKVN